MKHNTCTRMHGHSNHSRRNILHYVPRGLRQNTTAAFHSIHSWNFIGISHMMGLFLFPFLFEILPWPRITFNAGGPKIPQNSSWIYCKMLLPRFAWHFTLFELFFKKRQVMPVLPKEDVTCTSFTNVQIMEVSSIPVPEYLYHIPLTLFCIGMCWQVS